jgi:hypothetical protein
MAGGIYEGRPFTLNIKCVIFSAVMAGGYWFAPHKNWWILGFLLWFPYIAMATYDYAYDCRDKLGPTAVPFGRLLWLPFKPPGYKAEFNKMAAAQKDTMNALDHLVAWTAIVGALVLAVRMTRRLT